MEKAAQRNAPMSTRIECYGTVPWFHQFHRFHQFRPSHKTTYLD